MNTTADTRIIPRGRLVADLHGAHLGRPIVVIGGGPSAPEQWAKLQVSNPVVIFANGHGFKLGIKPDYIFAKDHRHTETSELVEPALRAHGRHLIVSQHYWADYRCGGWPTQGNSGQLAIAFAAFLGGHPVIPVGIDCYQKGTYFHAPAEKNVSLGRRPGTWTSSNTRLMLRLEGAVIRPAGGILTHTFRLYNREEVLPPPRIPQRFDIYKGVPTYYVRAVKPFTPPGVGKGDVPVGWVLPVTKDEHDLFIRNGVATSLLTSP